jgi:carboxyl-terminal processing protease
MNDSQGKRGRGFTWGAVGVAMVLLSAVSIAVPRAAAQTTGTAAQDSRSYFQVFENVYQFILKNYVDTVDPKILYEGAMKGMFEALGDPYSVFLNDKMMSGMNDLTEGVFGGVGLYISKQAKDARLPEDAPRFIEVVSPIEDTPGWKAGFKPGDLLLSINGEGTDPLSADDAMARIRGKPGSNVSFHVRRGKSMEFDITVARAIIEIPTVRKAIIPTPKGNVGYLRIIDFTPQTVPRVQDAIASFDKAGYRAMVIDVRSNPGGLLQSVVQIADLFLDKGTIVSTQGRSAFESSVNTANPDLAVSLDKPIIILIDRGSASASEILAGALKDQKRAVVIGEKSYGKGVVQRVYPIDTTGFKLTVSRYYTPSGGSIDKTGITPDIEVKEPDLTDAETAEIEKLYSSGKIANFADAHPNASAAERDAFAESLLKEGSKLSPRILGRLIRDELSRTSVAPAYDLEFDTVLAKALETIDRGDYADLLAKAKTVKENADALKAASAKK